MASTLVWNSLTANVTEKAEVEGIASGNVTMPDGVTYQNAVILSTIRTTVTGPSPFGTYLTVEEHSKVFGCQVTPYLLSKYCMYSRTAV